RSMCWSAGSAGAPSARCSRGPMCAPVWKSCCSSGRTATRKCTSSSIPTGSRSIRWLKRSFMSSNPKTKAMQSLKVELGERSYPIHVGAGILERAGEFLAQAGLSGKVAVVTNPVVAQLYLDTVHEALRAGGFSVTPVVLPDGEEHKTLASLT